MSREVLETIEQDGWTAKLYQDEEPMSPKEWDRLGTLATWHRRYCFEEDGNKRFGESSEFFKEAKKGKWVFLLVGMYDHSGITFYEGGGPYQPFDAAGWDSGTVGVLYTTPDRIKAIMGIAKSKQQTPEAKETITKALRSELKEWDQYVTGDVYGYAIEDPDGEHKDSCFGFYGMEYAKQEATSALKQAIKYEQEQAAKIKGMMRL